MENGARLLSFVEILEGCSTAEGQRVFFTTHSHAFYRSLLASVLYPCRGVSDVMDEEEAVQLLGIFLAFVNSTSDRRSFRMWWVPFRSRFLEVAYPTPAGTRLRSLSVDAWLSSDSSPRSRRPNSMLHIILCMLVDWTKHPHHARAMLLLNRPSGEQQRPPQEEGEEEMEKKTKEEEEGSADDSEQEQEAVDNDTAQYLLDLCGHLCTTLPLVDESLPMLRPLMQLYHNLAVHPLLARWQHIARFRQDFFARLGRLLVAKDSTGLRAMAKETYIDTVENQLPTYDSQTRDFFFSSLCELLEDQIQYHLNYPPSPTLDEQLRLLIQFALFLLVRSEDTSVHTWQQFHYALKQYFSIPTLHYAYLSVLEDWGRTIAELIAQDAFPESSGRQFVSRKLTVRLPPPQPLDPTAQVVAPTRPASVFDGVTAQQWQRSGESDFLDHMLLISRRLLEILPGLSGLIAAPSSLMAFLKRLGDVLEVHIKPFMTKQRYQHIANESEDGLHIVKLAYEPLLALVEREKSELLACRGEALRLICRLFLPASRLLQSKSLWDAFFGTVHNALNHWPLLLAALQHTEDLFSARFDDCSSLIECYCTAIRTFLADDMAKSDQIRPSAVRVLCRILNVVLRGALPTLAPGCLPVMPPLDELHALGDIVGMVLRVIEEETDSRNKVECLSTLSATLVALLEIHCLYPHCAFDDDEGADTAVVQQHGSAEENEQRQAQMYVRRLIEQMLAVLKSSCSFMETPEVVAVAVSSLSVLTSIYPTLMFTRDPLGNIRSIIEMLCQNAIDSGPELWKYYCLGLREWLSLPFPFLHDEALVSLLFSTLEMCILPDPLADPAPPSFSSLLSLVCPMFPLMVPISPTALLSSTSSSFSPIPHPLPVPASSSYLDQAGAVFNSLYQRLLHFEETKPQEAKERCRLTEGRAEALLLHLLYAYNFRKGNPFVSLSRTSSTALSAVAQHSAFYSWGSSVFLVREDRVGEEIITTAQVHNGTGSFGYRGDALREVVLPRNPPQGKKILDQLQPTVRLPLPHAALVAPAEDTHVTPHAIHATVDSMERFVRRLTGLPEKDVFKVGVVYVGPGQDHQSDILANSTCSSAFRTFMSQIGSTVYLPHHTGYAGGLSVEQELEMPFSTTPTTELMFHVAPFFPTATDDPQQVHKKRHIGNDELNVVWSENDVDYDISTLRTKVTCLYIILYPLRRGFVRVQLKSTKPGPFLWGPLQDGMIVPTQSLATLVRWTIINVEVELLRTAPFCNAYIRRKEQVLESLQRWRQERDPKLHQADVALAVLPTKERQVILEGLQLTSLPWSLIESPSSATTSSSSSSSLRSRSLSSLLSSLDPSSSATLITSPSSESLSALPSPATTSPSSSSVSSTPSNNRKGSAALPGFEEGPITHLSLSFNRLAGLQLSGALGGLEELRLSHNRLAKLARLEGLIELRRLRCLDLSHNLLADLSLLAACLAQGKLARLERLFLHNNRIAFLPLHFVAMFGGDARGKDKASRYSECALGSISLDHNPLLLPTADATATETAQATLNGELPGVTTPPTLRAMCWQLAVQRGTASSTSRWAGYEQLIRQLRSILDEGRAAARECSLCGCAYIGAPVATARRPWAGSLLGQPARNFTVGGDACSLSCARLLQTQLARAASAAVGAGNAGEM